ncbi:Yip1-like protein [Paenibacillus taihuensis]|uniref:Yip1-like protein n=1 Tax=Paenibacillus taihuensis TaxID=1156355 RepID=A0A3D9QW14_9BACL|nr:YIP1 family protein [Paenibacillus taihuensis]REE69551.1 Yip1-like protein [Paenibacillus taihuensis]
MRELMNQLKYSWKVLLHPIDGYYELQYQGKGSILSASILFAAFYVCEIAVKALTSFIFNLSGLKGTSPLQLLVYTAVPLFIWMLSNYLVGAITNGQGSFKSLYISTAYALLPYIILSIPLALLSNALTDAEHSIYSFFHFVIMAWVVVMFYLQVKETQGYEIFEALKNILLVLFAAVLIVVFAVALYGICLQSYSFLIEFFREVLAFD